MTTQRSAIVDKWEGLYALLSTRGRLSSDLRHDGYRVTVVDYFDGNREKFELTRPTFDEAVDAMTARVREHVR